MGGSILSFATILLGLAHGIEASWVRRANHVEPTISHAEVDYQPAHPFLLAGRSDANRMKQSVDPPV